METRYKGEVVHGMKMGRKLGFPTANLSYAPVQLENGVHGVRVKVRGEWFDGVMNIGVKPTISRHASRLAEIHLIQFDGDLYEEQIEYVPRFFLRSERSFRSVEALVDQIKLDISEAKALFTIYN